MCARRSLRVRGGCVLTATRVRGWALPRATAIWPDVLSVRPMCVVRPCAARVRLVGACVYMSSGGGVRAPGDAHARVGSLARESGLARRAVRPSGCVRCVRALAARLRSAGAGVCVPGGLRAPPCATAIWPGVRSVRCAWPECARARPPVPAVP
eukprot:2848580-Pleurochrysis_carterae.AAC.1